jgi:S1-C subfamily serine protease
MREHYEHLAAALGLLTFALLVSWFHTGPLIPASSRAVSAGALTPLASDRAAALASSTLPAFELSTTTLETLFADRAPATTTPPPAAPPAARAPAPTAPPKPATSTPVAAAPAPTDELSRLKSSIVNILCIAHQKPLRSTSGSGIIIDSNGIILTVAHVAQSLLLAQQLGPSVISCTIRTGSPATDAYSAKVIYISEAWLKDNATTLITSQPTGTGEHDYALLAITGSAGKPLVGAFRAVPLAMTPSRIGDHVFIGSYGAQDLTGAQVRTSLYPTLATSTITNRYTFTSNTPDVLAIGGSKASQEGSSGGAVVNEAGELIGLITTSQVTGDVATREMRVLSPSYIRRSFKEDTGKDFDSFHSDSVLSTLISGYAETVTRLAEFLADAIGLSK